MPNRNSLARAAVSAITGLVLLAPSAVAAQGPAEVTVGHLENCATTLNASWDRTLTPGPTVTVQLYKSEDGGAWRRAPGFHLRMADEGAVTFNLRTSDVSTIYEVRVTKGPKHVVAIGHSNEVVCEASSPSSPPSVANSSETVNNPSI